MLGLKTIVCVVAVFAFIASHFGYSGVNGASVTVFSGSLEEFKEKFQSGNSKFSLVSFNDKGLSLKTCKSLASKLDGIVEIVAVNCKEDYDLCNALEIKTNTFINYPKNEKFNEEPNVENLYKFALSAAKIYNLGDMSVFYPELHDTLLHQEPAWLVTYCFNENEEAVKETEELNKELNCFSEDESRKLALALNGTIKVGKVDCKTSKEVCEIAKPKRSSPIVLYSYFPILQALYSLKDGVTTIEKVRDLIQQDEILTGDFKEIIQIIPSILKGQEKNDNFFDARFMKTKEEKAAIKKAEEEAAAKKAEEEAKKAAEEVKADKKDDTVIEVVADEVKDKEKKVEL